MGVVMVVACKGPLLHVVRALHSSCGFAGRLDGRQQKSDEHADDGNDNEEFNKSERLFASQVISLQGFSATTLPPSFRMQGIGRWYIVVCAHRGLPSVKSKKNTSDNIHHANIVFG